MLISDIFAVGKNNFYVIFNLKTNNQYAINVFSRDSIQTMTKLIGYWKLEASDENWEEYMKAMGKFFLTYMANLFHEKWDTKFKGFIMPYSVTFTSDKNAR